MNAQAQQQQYNNSISFYIPHMDLNITEEYIKETFKWNNIGTVIRVDFTPLHKKPGFQEDMINNTTKSAFVHMDTYNDNFLAQDIYNKVFLLKNAHKLQLDFHSPKYWLLLKNNNPIPNTMMNNAQIVENCRVLENRIDNIQQVLYQLIGGLFCENTQRNILEVHKNVLFSEGMLPIITEDEVEDTNVWGLNPTTRQGDSNEQRIQTIEERLRNISDLLFRPPSPTNIITIGDEDESISFSSHSSMPDLISVSSSSSVVNFTNINEEDGEDEYGDKWADF